MSIEVGSKLEGKVTGITNFGAFVELPNGSTGLVHISEVADNYVKDINDHFKVGDMVEVKVMNVGADGKLGCQSEKRSPNLSSVQNVLSARNVRVKVVAVLLWIAQRTLNKKWQSS